MIREKTDNLYFVKCRHCIMDIINSYSVDGKEIIPRPDYVDYYTIVKKNKDGSFTDVFNKDNTLVRNIGLEGFNIEEYYYKNIIFSLEPLSKYIKNYDSLSKREWLIVFDTITELFNLKPTYGYKYYYDLESKDLKLDNDCITLKRNKRSIKVNMEVEK